MKAMVSVSTNSPWILSIKLTAFLLHFALAIAELRQLQHPAKPDGSLSVMVFGDWGRRGTHNQSLVAKQMGIIGEKMDLNFIISTGDNFYDNGLKGINDALFDESFSNIYRAPSLQKQWYTVLGNHDYRGDVLAQLSPFLTLRDSRWFCMRSYIVNAEIADFIFVDTTPFQDKYFATPEDHKYDWRGVLPRKVYLSNLLKEVDLALKESSAKWKIVVGHHTMRSVGHHGDTTELVTQLLPILEANSVDFYINGHDHCLERISSLHSPLQFVTSGGGSKAWGGHATRGSPREVQFYYDGQGFMTIRITQTEAHLKFYDVAANVLHEWTASKPLYSTV